MCYTIKYHEIQNPYKSGQKKHNKAAHKKAEINYN